MVGELGDYVSWSASVDERWVANSRTDPRVGNVDIWLKDKNRSAWSRFTFDAAAESHPVFSPDGSRIAFGSTRAGVPGIYVKPTTAAGSEQSLAMFDAREIGAQDWSADGRLILYSAYNEKSSWDLGVVAADGRTPATLVIQSQHGERGGTFSPDVKWIAYDSTESGRREVWIQPFPPTGDRWQVSTTGGISPQWRRDGRELFYIAADGMLTAVSVAPGPVPGIGAATPLFQTLVQEGAAGFLVSSDCRRFLMTVPPPYADVTPIHGAAELAQHDRTALSTCSSARRSLRAQFCARRQHLVQQFRLIFQYRTQHVRRSLSPPLREEALVDVSGTDRNFIRARHWLNRGSARRWSH